MLTHLKRTKWVPILIVSSLTISWTQPAEAGFWKKIKCAIWGCGSPSHYVPPPPPPPPPNPVPVVNAGSNVAIEMGESIILTGLFSDKVADPPFKWTWKFGDGNTTAGTTNKVGAISAPHTYLQTGQFTATLEVTDKAGHKGNSSVTVKSIQITDNTCDNALITIRSDSSYDTWDADWAWDLNRVPNNSDYVLVQSGHEIILPETGQIMVKGLCIEQGATLRSWPNASGTPSSTIDLSATAIRNQGTIVSENGVSQGCNGALDNNGNCPLGFYAHATNGSNIKITAGRFVNETTGRILSQGNGGDDRPYLYFPNSGGAIDARGGHGGSIEISPGEFINEGLIQSGNGGAGDTFASWGDFVWGNAYGGNGGTIKVLATNLALSANMPSGQIKAGSGGYADTISRWARQYIVDYIAYNRWGAWYAGRGVANQGGKLYDINGGTGGNLSLNLGNMSGIIQGNDGAEINRTLQYPNVYHTVWIRVDPTTMTVDETTHLSGAENVVLFGGDDWVMDLRKLQPGAIQAKTITLAVGEGSTIDLRGISEAVFQSEQLIVFSDNIELEPNTLLEDLTTAQDIVQESAKILYNVDVSYEQHVSGIGKTVPVKFTVFNNGPIQDTYTIQVTSNQGWAVGSYPQQVTAEGLRRTNFSFDATLPTSSTDEDTLTVTVTSQGDPSVQAIAPIRVTAKTQEIPVPRSEVKADLTIALDNSFKMAKEFHTIANALEKLLMQQEVNTPSDDQTVNFFGQFSDSNLITDEAFDSFIEQYQPEPTTQPKPKVELLTFTCDGVQSRIVTENLLEIVNIIRVMTIKAQSCPDKAIDALNFAADNLNPKGQVILATMCAPQQEITDATVRLTSLGARTHVLMAGACENEAQEKAVYQQLVKTTGGNFYWLPKGEVTLELEAIMNEVITEALDSAGSYMTKGQIRDEAGNPIVGVMVQIGDKITTTDSTGYWETSGLFEGSYTLTANKDGYAFAPVHFELGNEEYRYTVKLEPVSRLTVRVKQGGAKHLYQGEHLTYTMSVVNGGEQTATGVTVTDLLPAGSKLVSLQSLEGGSCDTQTVTCQLPDLTTGEIATIQLEIVAEQAGNLVNIVKVSANEYPEDLQKKYKKVLPFLSVTVTDHPDPVEMLKTLHYTLTVELNHRAPITTATGVTLVTQLPTGVEFQQVTTVYGKCDTSNLPTITCELDDLSIATPDSISYATVEIEATLKDAGLLLVTQEAKVSANEYPSHTDRERTKISVPPEIKTDLTLVVDTTHSMQAEINGIIKALKEFLATVDSSQYPLIALVEFKDEVRVRAFTQDLSTMIEAVEALTAEGGGLCPEASVEAINIALNHINDNGTIFFITDASPYEDADIEKLTQRLREQRIKFNSIITGDCSDGNSWN